MRVGCAEFSSTFTLSQSISECLAKTDSWRVVSDTVIQQSMINISLFKTMISADVECVMAFDFKYSPVLQSIAHVSFTELLTLRVDGNQIRSVEIVAIMNCPHLKMFSFRTNQISSYRSMRKLKAKQLKQIFYDGNPTTEVPFFRECCFNQNCKIFLEYFSYDYLLGQNSYSLAAGWSGFSMIHTNRKKRVSQQSVWNMLSQKCKQPLDAGYW